MKASITVSNGSEIETFTAHLSRPGSAGFATDDYENWQEAVVLCLTEMGLPQSGSVVEIKFATSQ